MRTQTPPRVADGRLQLLRPMSRPNGRVHGLRPAPLSHRRPSHHSLLPLRRFARAPRRPICDPFSPQLAATNPRNEYIGRISNGRTSQPP